MGEFKKNPENDPEQNKEKTSSQPAKQPENAGPGAKQQGGVTSEEEDQDNETFTPSPVKPVAGNGKSQPTKNQDTGRTDRNPNNPDRTSPDTDADKTTPDKSGGRV